VVLDKPHEPRKGSITVMPRLHAQNRVFGQKTPGCLQPHVGRDKMACGNLAAAFQFPQSYLSSQKILEL
jgi:hypothetical protein